MLRLIGSDSAIMAEGRADFKRVFETMSKTEKRSD